MHRGGWPVRRYVRRQFLGASSPSFSIRFYARRSVFVILSVSYFGWGYCIVFIIFTSFIGLMADVDSLAVSHARSLTHSLTRSLTAAIVRSLAGSRDVARICSLASSLGAARDQSRTDGHTLLDGFVLRSP